MPYRLAHYYLLMLVPMTFIAFGPSFFFKLNEAPLVHHLHGSSSSLWLLLLILQSWAIVNKKRELHKTMGKALFLLVPFMVASFAMVSHFGAIRTVEQNPFYVEVGTALLTVDITLTFLTPYLVYKALKHRNNIVLHSGYMFSTILGLLGPIFARLFSAHIPGLQITGLETLHLFDYSLLLSIILTVIVAAGLYWKFGKVGGKPWLISGTIVTLSYVLYKSVGQTEIWYGWMVALANINTWSVFWGGALLGLIACYVGWEQGKTKTGSSINK